MHQPDDPGQHIHYHDNGNGVNKLVYGVAGVLTMVMLTIGGVALVKLYDMGERLARIESTVDILLRQK